MASIRNLTNLASMAVYTLSKGSITERLVLGSALLGTGIFIAHKIYTVALRIFVKPQPPVSLPKFRPSPERANEIERRLNEKYPSPVVVVPQQSNPLPLPEAQPHSLLTSLSINNQLVTKEKEVPLAQALHAYQELKTEIGGDEARFVFLTVRFLQTAGGLPPTLRWEERSVELSIPSHYNKSFAELNDKLRQVGLNLKNVLRSDAPLAKAQLKNSSSKDIYDLSDLYKTVKLQGPHILSSFEITLKKQQVAKAKHQLHESRLNIIDKTLSTIRAVLIDDLVASFPERHKEIYAIFGSNPETLRFVLENICWHALDRALESIEITFIPSKEKQQNIRKIDLEGQLAHVLKDEEKRKRAQACLVQILANPHNDEAIGSLVGLLLAEEGNSHERDSLVKRLQEPALQVEEESIQQELARLEAIQKFYHTVTIAAAVADEGKNALLVKKEGEDKREKITLRVALPPPPVPKNSSKKDQKTYAQEIDELSRGIVGAGQSAVQAVVSQSWKDALLTLDQELEKIPHLSPEICEQIMTQGWVKFNHRQALLPITGQHRWLITKKMIVQKLVKDSLQQKGSELVHEVGKGAASFVTTLYGRLVTALLAFDKRTREASQQDPKPADRIATAFFDSLLQCYQALKQVKKVNPSVAGERENGVVKELEKSGDMHPSASNKRSADAVFLGKLILELLSILQPEGLTADIHKVLVTALSQPGELEPTLIRKTIETYSKTIRPAAEPWIKPVGIFLIQALENIIERQSTHNFASQLSDWLDPVNINASLVDLLKQDASEITISERNLSNPKELVKWYNEDEEGVRRLLQERSTRDVEIEALERKLDALKKGPPSNGIGELSKELILKKTELARLDMELAPQLLRRIVIANVPSSFVGYVAQFVEDLFELIQYPRILRHVVFNVLEKSVQSLAKPLEENQTADLLDQPINITDDQSVFDFLFSDLLKTSFGNKIGELFWSMSPSENYWSALGMLAKTVTKTLPGHFVFTTLQKKIEDLIQTKFKDRKAINWSVPKLVVTMNARMRQFAENQSETGMTALIATQFRQVIGIK